MRLDQMVVGQKGVITRTGTNKDLERRFIDLGFTLGTLVECVLKAPSGDPTAFSIRGAVIAIRKKDMTGMEIKEN